MRKIFISIFLFSLSYYVYCDTTKVLFIGNSYTYFNDLPDLFKRLSNSAGKNVITDMSAPGGFTLEEHSHFPSTIEKINAVNWNYVVLQEQSQYPVIEYYRYNNMYPAAAKLDSMVKASGSEAMFYMTWGRKIGGQQCIGNYCSPVFIDFFHMQDSLQSAYTQISQLLGAKLCPVGSAWKKALIQDPNANLWDTDGSHPSLKGSYLAACMFYVIVFNESPVGLQFTAGLDSAEAVEFQVIAGSFLTGVIQTGLAIPEKYSLSQNYPNPFNPTAKIKFSIPKAGIVDIRVHDILGREMFSIFHGSLSAGNYETEIDGSKLSSGVYYYTLTVNEFNESRKMVLIK